jgi:hypothetical protein
VHDDTRPTPLLFSVRQARRHMGQRILYTIRETGTLPEALWRRFADVATANGSSILAVLAELMRQYIAQHERDQTNSPRQ